MRKYIIGALLPLILLTTANALEITAVTKSGLVVAVAGLSSGATRTDLAGSSVHVHSPLSAAMSNISSATVHTWPSDRKLVVEKGGGIGNTTLFKAAGPVIMAGGTFAGTGRLQFNGPFTVNGLYAALIGSGVVTFGDGVKEIYPEWFGAVGDGTTDDTAAFVKFTSAVSSGKVIKFGAGRTYLNGATGYNLNAWDSLTDVVFDGQNATLKIKANTSVSYAWGLYFSNSTNIVVRDLNVDGNRENLDVAIGDGVGHGIAVRTGCSKFLLSNIKTVNMGTDSIYIGISGSETKPSYVTVENGHFDSARRNNITLAGANEVTIINNKILNAGATVGAQAGALPKYGIDMEPNGDGDTYSNTNIKVLNNAFNGNLVTDLGLATTTQGLNDTIKIMGNTFNTSGTSTFGINLSGKIDRNITISSNNFTTGTGTIALGSTQATTVSNVMVNNNHFYHSGATTYALYVGNSGKTGFVISNNVFTGVSYLLYFAPTNGTAADNYINNNTYKFHTQCDVALTDADAVLINKATASNERFIRALDYKLRYKLASASLANNIEVQGATAVIFDNAVNFELPTSLRYKRGANVLEYDWNVPPATGTWAVGSRINNNYFQSTGAYAWAGWAYIAASSSWKPFGVIGSPVATASLPAGAAAMNGQIFIEDGPGDDENLIIYANGKRYRIDGGAAF